MDQFHYCSNEILEIISSLGCLQLIGYYCIAHHLSCLKQNSGGGDTAKTTGPIYLVLFFHGEIILSRKCMYFFFIFWFSPVRSVKTDEKQTIV